MGLGVHRPSTLEAAVVAALSQSALDRRLSHEAELTIAPISGDAVLVGAFDRAPSSPSPVFRRGSGGPPIYAGTGLVYVGVALAHPSALVPCTPDKLLNRYVRPVLRALTKVAAPAHYFGRDWVSVAKRPAAWIGFAHDSSTRRALVEAFIAVGAPGHRGAHRSSAKSLARSSRSPTRRSTTRACSTRSPRRSATRFRATSS
jgi:hypothetical protein